MQEKFENEEVDSESRNFFPLSFHPFVLTGFLTHLFIVFFHMQMDSKLSMLNFKYKKNVHLGSNL